MKILPDVLTFAGGGALFYGVHSVYPPAAWILAGAAAILIGFLLGRSE
jgi:hypothetical protein